MRTGRTKNGDNGFGNLKTKAILLATLALAATGLLVATAGAELMGDYSFVITEEAQQRTLAGECKDSLVGDICKELCLTTMDGYIIPQGDFTCTPP